MIVLPKSELVTEKWGYLPPKTDAGFMTAKNEEMAAVTSVSPKTMTKKSARR